MRTLLHTSVKAAALALLFLLSTPSQAQTQVFLGSDLLPCKADNQSCEQISEFILGATRVAHQDGSAKASVLIVSAGQTNPYQEIDALVERFNTANSTAKWLPITAASAQAQKQAQCALLTQNTDSDYARQAQQACEQPQQLTQAIEQATAVIIVGDDFSAWQNSFSGASEKLLTQLLASPVLVVQGALVELMSAHYSEQSPSSAQNLFDMQEHKSAQLAMKQGTGVFQWGDLMPRFSESNLTVAAALRAMDSQSQVYGIDENAALVVISAGENTMATVLGNGGVVKVSPLKERAFNYSYYPSGVRLQLAEKQLTLAANTPEKAIPEHLLQPLPKRVFDGILFDAKWRALAQAMCMTNAEQAQARQYYRKYQWDFTLQAQQQTQLKNTTIKANACAIENLHVTYQLASD